MNSVLAPNVKTIILACEAGMGSSLMSVNALKKKLKKADIEGVKVVHKAAREIPNNAQLVLVHKGLAKFVQSKVPDAVVISFSQFLNDPAFDAVVQAFVDGSELVSTEA
jgi:mannitol-specific phosphotransferase system IIBC component